MKSKIAVSQMVQIQSNDWLEKQRYAGKVLSDLMKSLEDFVSKRGDMTLLEMDRYVEEAIIRSNCTPTFKGYKGFPNSLITSVNKQLVHAIPSDYKLKEGDLISFDFGVTFEGVIVDSADTFIFGENKKHEKMIETARDCLHNAIKAIKPGKRVGVIGEAIYKTAKDNNFSVITSLGGHGIGLNKPHAPPFISNRSTSQDGIHICSGMTFAIEPLLVPGDCSTEVKEAEDGWTILTDDISVHVEHTVFVHDSKTEILTYRDNDKISRFVDHVV